jgi:hypothetical protein
VPLIPSFHSPADTIRSTTEELRSIAFLYTAGNKVAQLCPTSSYSGEASSDITI